MDVNDAYKELEKHLKKGKALLRDLDPSLGLTWKHHEWGEYAKTVISVIDPNGEIFDESTPVGMFYNGWNTATFYWSDCDDKTQIKRNVEGFASAVGALLAIVKTRPLPRLTSRDNSLPTRLGYEVFLIHGHDTAARETVASYLRMLGIKVCILHEMANSGRTIIEKFEHYSNVGFAIALLTADDLGCSKAEAEQQNPRARQNVVFEFGYFIGKLGRDRVCALVDQKVERPSDLDGLVYIPLDSTGGWKIALAKDLKAVGFKIDLNHIV